MKLKGSPVENAYIILAVSFALQQPGALTRWGEAGCEILREFLETNKED